MERNLPQKCYEFIQYEHKQRFINLYCDLCVIFEDSHMDAQIHAQIHRYVTTCLTPTIINSNHLHTND